MDKLAEKRGLISLFVFTRQRQKCIVEIFLASSLLVRLSEVGEDSGGGSHTMELKVSEYDAGTWHVFVDYL
jgi:hypothetical protein